MARECATLRRPAARTTLSDVLPPACLQVAGERQPALPLRDTGTRSGEEAAEQYSWYPVQHADQRFTRGKIRERRRRAMILVSSHGPSLCPRKEGSYDASCPSFPDKTKRRRRSGARGGNGGTTPAGLCLA